MKILEGVKVVDFTHAYSGPFLTLMLADFGAEVIKIERVDGGDQARCWGPFKNNYSGYYASFSRGKRSITIDISSDEGRKIIYELVKDADIVCSNFKAGTMEKYGYSYEELKAIKPDIIYAALSGFGTVGELAGSAAYDNVMQGMSGIMDVNGFPGKVPMKIGPAIGDSYSGLVLLVGLLMAYYSRLETGKGQRIDATMLGSLFTTLEYPIMEYANNGKLISRNGNSSMYYAPGDAYKVNDGYVALSVKNEDMWKKFTEMTGIEIKPEYADNAGRLENKEMLREDIEKLWENLSRRQVEELLSGTDIPCAGVVNIVEALEDEHLKLRDMIISVDDPALGQVTLVGNPIKLSKAEYSLDIPSPTLGQHTMEIMKELGYDEETYASYKERKIV